MPAPDRPNACELCGRPVRLLTKHHLIPRMRHRNRRAQREFDREEMRHRLAWFCRPCHNHVHALFTEKTLERDFNTLAALATHPDVAKFTAWIRDKPEGLKPANQEARGKGKRRCGW